MAALDEQLELERQQLLESILFHADIMSVLLPKLSQEDKQNLWKTSSGVLAAVAQAGQLTCSPSHAHTLTQALRWPLPNHCPQPDIHTLDTTQCLSLSDPEAPGPGLDAALLAALPTLRELHIRLSDQGRGQSFQAVPGTCIWEASTLLPLSTCTQLTQLSFANCLTGDLVAPLIHVLSELAAAPHLVSLRLPATLCVGFPFEWQPRLWEAVAGLPRLQHLTVAEGPVHGESFARVSALQHLTRLSLLSVRLRDRGPVLQALSQLPLQDLHLRDEASGYVALQELAACTTLRRLHLFRGDDASLAGLDSLPLLEHLSLKAVSAKGTCLEGVTGLTSLQLLGCCHLSPHSLLRVISNNPRLAELHLEACSAFSGEYDDEDDRPPRLTHRPPLRVLRLIDCPSVTEPLMLPLLGVGCPGDLALETLLLRHPYRRSGAPEAVPLADLLRLHPGLLSVTINRWPSPASRCWGQLAEAVPVLEHLELTGTVFCARDVAAGNLPRSLVSLATEVSGDVAAVCDSLARHQRLTCLKLECPPGSSSTAPVRCCGLSGLTRLRTLSLAGHSGLRDASPLSCLTRLTDLDLGRTGVRGSSVHCIATLRDLRRLRLSLCAGMDAAAVGHLRRLSSLQSLFMQPPQGAEKPEGLVHAVRALPDALPRLEKLCVGAELTRAAQIEGCVRIGEVPHSGLSRPWLLVW